MSEQRDVTALPLSYRVEATATVLVDVRNPDVIERVTGPDGDEWRNQFYRTINTHEDVIAHIAFNAVANGVLDVNRLEGWADCGPDDVKILVDQIETHVEEWS